MNAKLNPLNEKFSVEKALRIQHVQVEDWRSKLNPALFEALRQWVIEQNNDLPKDACGYDVLRGDGLLDFILNAKLVDGEWKR